MPFLNWFLPRPHSFRSPCGNSTFGFLGAVLLRFFFHFCNSISTFWTDPLLALLPPAKFYCFAIFYTWPSLFSLQIPPPPPTVAISESSNDLLCAKDLHVQICRPKWGASQKAPQVTSTPRGCDLTWWVARLYLQVNLSWVYLVHALFHAPYVS